VMDMCEPSLECLYGDHRKCKGWFWSVSFEKTRKEKIPIREKVECTCECHVGDVYEMD
jgi:hypothetical protein